MKSYYYFMGTASNVSKKTGNRWWAVKVFMWNTRFNQMEIKLIYCSDELFQNINQRGYEIGLALDLFLTPDGLDDVQPSKTYRPLALGAKL